MNQPNNVLRKVDFDIPSDTSGAAAALTLAPIILSDRPHLSFFIGYNVTGCETKYVDGWSRLSATSKGHILEGLNDYIEGRFEEFATIEELIEDLHAQNPPEDA